MRIVTADITGSLILNGVDVTQITVSSSIWSGSIAGRVTNLESTASTLVAASSSFAASSASIAGRVTVIENNYATTGSNRFNGNQTVTGSLTVTNQIVAQTLNVQQVTSSVVFSSGSNIFGNNLANTQQFTGSVSVTGSLVQNGNPVILQGGNSVGTQLLVGTNDNQNLALETNGSVRMFVSSSGNVGIGTTSPLHRFTTFTGGNETVAIQDQSGYGSLVFKHVSTGAFRDGMIDAGNLLLQTQSGGRVGIGTTSPSARLHIVGGNGDQLMLDNTGQAFTQAYWRNNGTNIGAIWASTSEFSIYTYSTQPIIFHTNTSERMRITAAGNVGIGTTSPSTLLHVAGAGTFSGVNTGGYLYVTGNAGSGGVTNPVYQAGLSLSWNRTNGDGESNLIYTNAGGGSNVRFRIGYWNNSSISEQLTILSSGNVGIGTTSPTSRLQSNNASVYSSSTASGAVIASNLSNGNAIVDIGVDASILGYIQSRNIANTTTYNLLLNPLGGNVGIGTTSPTGRLNVIQAGSTGFTPTTTGPIGGGPNSRVHIQGGETGLMLSSDISPTTFAQTGTQSYQLGLQIGMYAVNDIRNQIYFGNAPLTFVYSGNQGVSISEYMRITSGGNVGIGTTAPSARLDVLGGIQAAIVRTSDASTFYTTYQVNTTTVVGYIGNGNGIVSGGGVNTFGVRSESDLIFAAGGNAERMRITSAGNVLIATSTTLGNGANTNPLQVYGGVTIAAQSGVFTYATLQYSGTDFVITGNAHPANLGTNSIVFRTGTTGGGGPQEWMRVTSNGNVGIGTTSPSSLLQVNGTVTTGADIILNPLSDDGRISFKLGAFDVHARIIGDVTNASPVAGNLQFYTSTGGTLTERMRIAENGNVGIGTTSPSVLLHLKKASSELFVQHSDNNTLVLGGWDGSKQYIKSINLGVALTPLEFQASSYSFTTGAATFSSLGTGTVYSNGGTLTNTNPSDSNLKENIKPISYGLDEILKLNPVTFNWKEDRINQGTQYGFIAQEVQKVMPDLVKSGEYLGLDKEAIFTILVKAIQELKAELDLLKK